MAAQGDLFEDGSESVNDRQGPENGSPDASMFRWAMLGLAVGGTISQGVLFLQAVPVALYVERDLQLTASQVAFWINLRAMASFLFSIPVGILVDRWGAKKVGRFGFTALALGATARGFTGSYEQLLAVTAVYAIGAALVAVCLPKALALWFPSRQMGMASGIYVAGYGLGSSIGLSAVHPAFGESWRDSFAVLGLIGITATVCWWLFARESESFRPKQGAALGALMDGFKKAAGNRVTWLLTAIFFLYAAAYSAWFTFGFPFLVRFRDVSENTAGFLIALTKIGYIVAALSMPGLSDRLGYRRPFLMFYAVGGFLLFLMMVYWTDPIGIGIAGFLIGMCLGTVNPLVFTIAAEAKEIGPTLMGASLGIISSVSAFAGFVIPALLGHMLGSLSTASEQQYRMVLVLGALFLGGIFVCGWLLRETGAPHIRLEGSSA